MHKKRPHKICKKIDSLSMQTYHN